MRSTTTDQSRLAVYGATRSVDGALTVMVINKSNAASVPRLSSHTATSPTAGDIATPPPRLNPRRHRGRADRRRQGHQYLPSENSITLVVLA